MSKLNSIMEALGIGVILIIFAFILFPIAIVIHLFLEIYRYTRDYYTELYRVARGEERREEELY